MKNHRLLLYLLELLGDPDALPGKKKKNNTTIEDVINRNYDVNLKQCALYNIEIH